MKNLKCFIIFFTFPFLMFSQDQEKSRYLNFGPGWAYNKTVDEGYSSLLYKGHLVKFTAGYESNADSSKRVSQLNIRFFYGNLKPKIIGGSSTPRIMQLRGDINYRLLFHVTDPEAQLSIFAGGGFLTTGVFRLHQLFSNNHIQYEYANSLSAELLFKYLFHFKKRKFKISWGVSQPLLSIMVHPAYDSSLPKGYLEHPEEPVKAALASIQLKTFNYYYRIISRTAVTYFLKNGNALRLGYHWDFYHYGKLNKVSSATHMISFSTLFRLTK